MTFLQLLAIEVAMGLVTFYATVRVCSRRLRAGDLGDWDSPGVFCFAIVMGVIWPLTIVWALAQRPSRAERRDARLQAAVKRAADLERRARSLGIGDEP